MLRLLLENFIIKTDLILWNLHNKQKSLKIEKLTLIVFIVSFNFLIF